MAHFNSFLHWTFIHLRVFILWLQVVGFLLWCNEGEDIALTYLFLKCLFISESFPVRLCILQFRADRDPFFGQVYYFNIYSFKKGFSLPGYYQRSSGKVLISGRVTNKAISSDASKGVGALNQPNDRWINKAQALQPLRTEAILSRTDLIDCVTAAPLSTKGLVKEWHDNDNSKRQAMGQLCLRMPSLCAII